MSWKPIRGKTTPGTGALPGERGRYLLFLGPPIVPGGPRWVHFSWRGANFCICDFIEGQERRQEPGLTASDVWRAAIKRLPAIDEYFHRADDIDWWTDTLKRLPLTR